MMPPMAEWLGRCQAAREQGEPIPLPALFRRMLEHSEWYCREGVGEAEDFFVAGHLTPDASECVDGLRLAAALNPTLPTMNLHHAAGMPPLVLDRPEVRALLALVSSHTHLPICRSRRFFFALALASASETHPRDFTRHSRQLDHFRSFLGISVVEALLTRMRTRPHDSTRQRLGWLALSPSRPLALSPCVRPLLKPLTQRSRDRSPRDFAEDGADLEVDEPFAKLRAFDGFLTVCAGVPGAGEPSPHSAAPSMRLALAPDVGGEGRKLAAAFTAEDALQHFIAARDGAQADDGARPLAVVPVRFARHLL